MKTKLIEIRDRSTTIVALCIDMNPDNPIQRAGLRSYGYPCDGVPNIMITHATGGYIANNDCYGWNDRTFAEAHYCIIERWNELDDGDVIDVEYEMGETSKAKEAERLVVRD